MLQDRTEVAFESMSITSHEQAAEKQFQIKPIPGHASINNMKIKEKSVEKIRFRLTLILCSLLFWEVRWEVNTTANSLTP